jgi:hypothetical protein
MSGLRVLKLNSNKLSGPVPKAWAGLPALRTLSLYDNPDLSGCLPAGIAGGTLQAPGGRVTPNAKEAAAGTKISAFC